MGKERVGVRNPGAERTQIEIQEQTLFPGGFQLRLNLFQNHGLSASSDARDDLDEVAFVERPDLRQVVFTDNHLCPSFT